MSTQPGVLLEIAYRDGAFFEGSTKGDVCIRGNKPNQSLHFGSSSNYPPSFTLNNDMMVVNAIMGVGNGEAPEAFNVESGNAYFSSNIYVMDSVGIRTSEPTEALDVQEGNIKVNDNILVGTGVSIANGMVSPTEVLDIGGNIKVSSNAYILNKISVGGTSNPSEALTVIGNTSVVGDSYITGKVGIGTTSPSEALDVIENAIVRSNLFAFNKMMVGGNTNPTESLEVIGNTSISGSISAGNGLETTHALLRDTLQVYEKTCLGSSNYIPTETLDVRGNVRISSNLITHCNVMIGSNGFPVEKLEVIGNVKASSNLYVSGRLGIGTTVATEQIEITNNMLANGSIFAMNKIGVGTRLPSESLDVIGNINARTNLYVNNRIAIGHCNPVDQLDVSSNIRVRSNGYFLQNVGIRTSNPTEALHIIGNARIEGNLDVWGIQNTVQTDLKFADQVTVSNVGTGPGLQVFQMGTQPVADFYDDSNLVMRINDGGFVGIGFSNPTYRLHVNGTMYATGYCNLLLNSYTSTSFSNAPTANALKQIADIAMYSSNALGGGGGGGGGSVTAISMYGSNTANWSSNTVDWSSNTVNWSSNNFVKKSGDIFTGSVAATSNIILCDTPCNLTYPPPEASTLYTSSNVTLTTSSYGNGLYKFMASSTVDMYQMPWRAFDSISTGYWQSSQAYTPGTGVYNNSNSTTVDSSNFLGEWLDITLPLPINITGFRMYSGYIDSRYSVRDFSLVASSNSGSTWTLLLTSNNCIWTSNLTGSNNAAYFAVNTNQAFNRYRIVVSRLSNWDYAEIDYLAFDTGVYPTERFSVVQGKLYSDTQCLGNSNDSALIPSFSFKENSNTGIFHPSNNAIGFTTGGSEKVRIDNVGNVGISTQNPAFKLDVTGTLRTTSDSFFQGYAYIQKSAGTSKPINTFGGALSFNSTNGHGGIDYIDCWDNSNARTSHVFWFLSNNTLVNQMMITRSNFVGIGTSSPSQRLDVNGTIQSTMKNGPGLLLYSSNGWASIALSNMRGGMVELGLSYSHQEFSTNAGSNDFIIRNSFTGGKVHIQNGSSSVGLCINSNNRVGIGTVNPMSALDVTGDASVGSLQTVSNRSISSQGLHFQWNRSGTGEGWIINQKGLGTGALLFATSDLNNTLTEWARFDSNGNFGIGTTSPSYKLYVNGIIYGGNDIIAFSDIRAKSNLEVITDSLDKVSQLTGYTYDMITTSQSDVTSKIKNRYTGIIAQDLEKVLPEAVHKDHNGYLSIAYGNLAGLFVESIKQLNKEKQALKERVSYLERRLQAIETHLQLAN